MPEDRVDSVVGDPPPRRQRPVMQLLDLLERRWTLRVIWEVGLAEGSFGELQERCGGLSPTVLSKRLAELTEAGILEHVRRTYSLTDQGVELREVLIRLDAWADTWMVRQEA